MPPPPEPALRRGGGTCAQCGRPIDRRAQRCRACANRAKNSSEHQRAAARARHAAAREDKRLAALARAAGLG